MPMLVKFFRLGLLDTCVCLLGAWSFGCIWACRLHLIDWVMQQLDAGFNMQADRFIAE